jgi:phosphoribosylglycinamide formyltransferase-1
MHRIAIFASGSGSNAENIARFFAGSEREAVVLFLTNNPKAGVIDRGRNLGIPVEVFQRPQLNETGEVIDILKKYQISFIVLAGFLWLIPENLLNEWPGRVINIHPALLPKYGGKGMFGMKVHQAVADHQDTETGITIHYVNPRYDEGDILFRASCKVERNDTPEKIAEKVHLLEYQYFPVVIRELLESMPVRIPR